MTRWFPLLWLVACGPTTSPGAAPIAPPAATPATPPAEEPAPAPPEPAPVAEQPCADRADRYSPVIVTEEDFAARRGADATAYSALQTSREEPARACGPAGSYEWLAGLACDDGSQPFANPEAAAEVREAAGDGGACGNPVDRYRITCPDEGEREVFVDMYWCVDAEDFARPLTFRSDQK